MIIRTARVDDAECIAGFWNPLIRDTSVTFSTIEKTPEGLRADIKARGDAFLVAEDSGQVVGLATYGPFRGGPGYRHTVEHTVILAPCARGQGTGRALMARLEDQARHAGLHVMVAGVSSENPGAVAFHERIGYQKVGLMPETGRKFGRWMDLILLQKLL
ncbi:N-acyltransferase YncA [Roseovarius litorisediminis]|uniref:N-acyltransferase YncA n=1 Tax=Roseovarius litorisediminis TaxID=1312363 RepID=A0A1Y5TIE9_9RHOB|nr:GNAT family N-acetyltransferase [Roseovarius litorisediminis]SLN64425.1 N-acyltransferase YncA [Roseovarius litorisediminis]